MKKIIEPKAYLVVEVTCDRCGKTAREEIDTESAADVQSVPTRLPEGWVEVQHPEGEDGILLTFCQRACTSTWFSAFVRRIYGVPEPGPRRRKGEVTTQTMPVELEV